MELRTCASGSAPRPRPAADVVALATAEVLYLSERRQQLRELLTKDQWLFTTPTAGA